MSYTPIAPGTQDWDVPVNAAFTDQDARITTNTSGLATASTNISTLQGQMSTANTNITTLQNSSTGQNSASNLGALGWSLDPASVSSGQTGTAGTLYLARINVGTSTTATKLLWGINTPGVSPVAGQNFVSLFDSTGARLANVGVDARVTTTGLFTETISVALTPGFYWVGFLFNASTMPAVYRAGFINATLVNMNQPVATARFVNNGTGLTATPASITPSSNVHDMRTYFAALDD